MQITESNISHYLLDKGLIDISSIMEGQLSIGNLGSRNRNYSVVCGDDKEYLLKQVKHFEVEKISSLVTEATFYWLANNDLSYKYALNHIPRYIDYDTRFNILIIKLLSNSINLHDFYLSTGQVSAGLAKRVGIILADCHKCGNQQLEKHPFFKCNLPWIFEIDNKPTSYFQIKNQADFEILELVKSDKKYTTLIRESRNLWNTTNLIHGDIKWTNFILEASRGEETLKLIDWEIADIGDRCWDIAGVLHSYLALWVFSDFNLEKLQPSIRSFWVAYRQHASIDISLSYRIFLKSIKFAGIRIIQTCLESTYNTTNLHFRSARILQLGFNILNEPELALTNLFGLSESEV